MASWADFEKVDPDFAAAVKEVLDLRKHKAIATLRKDGSPRASGIEAEISEGELTFGSMPNAMKGKDLKRDGRFELLAGSDDPPGDDPTSWKGDVKIFGIAIFEPGHGHDHFRADIANITHVSVVTTDKRPRLQIKTWSPTRGTTTAYRD